MELNGAVSESPDIPIEFDNTSAESRDYDVDGLNSDDELEFSRGDDSQSFTIETNSDSCPDDDNERLTVSFGSLPSEVSSDSPTSAVVTIYDDDNCITPPEPDPKVYFANSRYSVNEEDTIHIRVNVTGSGPTSDVDIPIDWTNGSGTVNSDYAVHLESGNTIEIDAGDSYKTFQFDAEDDTDCRNEEITFRFGRLPSGIDEGSTNTTTVTIVDNDCTPMVSVSASPNPAEEGDRITFTIKASPRPSGSSITVNLTHKLTGNFFLNSPQRSVVITAGNATTSFEVRTDDDSTVEDVGSVRVNVVSGTGYDLGDPNTITVPVEDNDSVKPTITLSASSTSVVEGNYIGITVNADPAPTSRMSVYGTMSWPDRVFWDDEMVVFSAGSTSRVFTIRTHDDTSDDPPRTFTVAVSTNSEYKLGNPSSIDITELDDDPTKISFGSSSYDVDEGESVSVSVNLTLAPETVIEVPINVVGSGHTVSGLPNDELTFTPNSSSESFTIEATEDNSDCRNHRVDLSFGDLSSLGLELGSNPTATVDIDDNEHPDVCRPPLGSPGTLTHSLTETRGSVSLQWNRASNASSIQLQHCEKDRNDTGNCSLTPLDTLGGNTTGVTVASLDPDKVHQFRVRARRGSESEYSTIVTVDLKPAPENLIGVYTPGQHRKVTLTWDPVPNPNAAYFIEQKFPNPNPVDSGWEVLPHDGVEIGSITMDGNRLELVVSNLYPGDIGESGRDYEFRIKAQSAQGTSAASNEFTVKVLNERPTTAPGNALVVNTLGYRYTEFSWTADVVGADYYFVRVKPDNDRVVFDPDGVETVTRQTGSAWHQVHNVTQGNKVTLRVRRLPERTYSFIAAGWNGSGLGPEATLTYKAEEPLHVWGHQADHNVKYEIDSGLPVVISQSIGPAVSTWNNAISGLNQGLNICEGMTCSDDHIVLVKTTSRENKSTTITHDPDKGCGKSNACVKFEFDTEGDSDGGVGDHMGNMTMAYENPPWTAWEVSKDNWVHQEWEWTDISSDHNMLIPSSTTIRFYYVDRVMVHEFGHTLGLPDFYTDEKSGLKGLTDAVMHTSRLTIHAEDINQLRAIYFGHTKHDHD